MSKVALAHAALASQRLCMRMLLFLAALLSTPIAAAQTLDDLTWLKGCWRTQGDGPVVSEVWLAPPMPALLGYSYTIDEGQVQGWEQTRIEMIDGWPYFIAMPNGGAPVRFRLREMRTHAGILTNPAVFDNPEHDYPQTVEYHRVGEQLTARISGSGDANPTTFTYRRIRCSAELRP